MDKKLKLAIIILSAVLLALGTVALVLVLTDGEEPNEAQKTPGTMDQPAQSSTSPLQSSEDKIPTEPSQEDAPVSLPTSQVEEIVDPPQSQQPTSGTTPIQNPTQKPTQPQEISFPYTIPGTSLVVTKIDSYDGIFLEDGSDRSVTGICALVLTNSGKTDVEYADITVKQGSRELLFKATVLKAGCTVVVQEANAAAYASGSYESCTAQVAEAEELEMHADQVKVAENQDGSFTVTNLTGKTIVGIRIFYKFCLTKGSVYVGGITYTAKVENLAPGATQTVYPTHYSFGSSEVVMVRLYESLS